jgi:hypothetical protein
MYLPRFSGVDRSAVTVPSIGSGTLLMKWFTGKGTAAGGTALRTGRSVRTYATIDARSSSDITRKRVYGMTGKSVRPSCPIPSRTARAIASSDHFPAPVSGSGVMFGTVSHGTPGSIHFCPAPTIPGFTVQSSFVSTSEWQTRHGVTPLVR